MAKLQLPFAQILGARPFVWWVLAIGLALRLAWVLCWDNQQIIGDYIWLNERAKDLAAGKGYGLPNGEPTAFWPIGYPLSLSIFYRVCGPHDLAGKLANVAYSMGILAGTYLLGRRLFSEQAARLGLLLLTLVPNQIAYNSLLATEPLFTMLLTVALVIAFSAKQHRWTGLALGVILGLACNVKPVTLGLFPIFAVCLWAVLRDWKKALSHMAVAAAVSLLILLPWLLRNHRVFGRWMLTNEAGLVLLVGANPDATGEYYRAPIIDYIYPRLQQGGQEEYRWNREAQRLALQFIRQHPVLWLKLGCKKLFHMYKHDLDGIRHTLIGMEPRRFPWTYGILSKLGRVYYAAVMLLTIASLALSASRREWFTLPDCCLLFVFYFSLVSFTFHGLPRYHYPLMPIFCLFAARFVELLLLRKAVIVPTAPDRK